MLRRLLLAFLLAGPAAAACALQARAATFDLIYADHIQVTTFPTNGGFTLAGTDIGLVVNKGVTNILAAEFFGTTFTASSSSPLVKPLPFINNPGPAITPIIPNEAIGSVSGANTVLTTKLLPGEIFANTTPYQVISLEVSYPPGFSGHAVFDITMTMGGVVATYSITADFTLGAMFNIVFPSASRISGVPLVTPVQTTSWGRIKALYR